MTYFCFTLILRVSSLHRVSVSFRGVRRWFRVRCQDCPIDPPHDSLRSRTFPTFPTFASHLRESLIYPSLLQPSPVICLGSLQLRIRTGTK